MTTKRCIRKEYLCCIICTIWLKMQRDLMYSGYTISLIRILKDRQRLLSPKQSQWYSPLIGINWRKSYTKSCWYNINKEYNFWGRFLCSILFLNCIFMPICQVWFIRNTWLGIWFLSKIPRIEYIFWDLERYSSLSSRNRTRSRSIK